MRDNVACPFGLAGLEPVGKLEYISIEDLRSMAPKMLRADNNAQKVVVLC